MGRGSGRRGRGSDRARASPLLPVLASLLLVLLVVLAGLGLTSTVGAPDLPGFLPGGSGFPVRFGPDLPGLAPGAKGSGASSPVVPLTVGRPIANTSPDFWGVVVQTAQPTAIESEPAIGQFLNSTPFHVFSYTLNTDNCNMSSDTYYVGDGNATTPCPFSLPAFVAWCDAKGAGCTSIVKLPGENNDSEEDAYLAAWIVDDLGFQPTYWTIGNEPMLWTHYGLPWADWRSTDRSVPTPLAYAVDVRNAILAVRAVDPPARFIGIESDCECSAKDYMAAVTRVDGALISAVGYHTYPSTAGLTNETLTQFFAPLTSPKNLSGSYATVRLAIGGPCRRCAEPPIFVTEYNSGPGRSATQWAGTYADAEFLAASIVQALTVNVTMFVTYNLQSYAPPNATTQGWGLLTYNGSIGPEGVLYSELVPHLATGLVYATSLPSPVGNVWAVATSTGAEHSLLLVDANVTEPVTVALPSFGPLENGTAPTLYSWQWGEPAPVASGAPGILRIPALGMALVDYTS